MKAIKSERIRKYKRYVEDMYHAHLPALGVPNWVTLIGNGRWSVDDFMWACFNGGHAEVAHEFDC